MKLSQPLGDANYGPLLFRITLGGYFLIAGLLKFHNIPGFIREVHSYRILPEHLGTLYAILLPHLEMGVGILLLLGIWATLSGILASLMLLSYVVALGVFPHSNPIFNKDIVLLAGALSLCYSGAGAISVDRFRKGGGGG